MQISRRVGSMCFAALASLAILGAANGLSAGSHAPPKPTTSPSVAPSPSTSGCDTQLKVGEVTLCSEEFTFNFKSGDVQFPKPIHGRAADGTYRADRGYGNLHSQIMNLIGHVVIHRNPGKDKAGKPVEAMTLVADQTHIESKAKFYRASGNVKVTQGQLTLTAPLVIDDESHRTISASGGVKVVKGDKTLTAPQIVLDNSTHIATLTGGVHADQIPNRSFDATEVIYNTQTEDFKALGNVKLEFPASQPAPTATPSARPSARPSASQAPARPPAPKPTGTPRRSE